MQRQPEDQPDPGRSERNAMSKQKILSALLLSAAAMSSTALAGERDFNTLAGAVIGASIGMGSGGSNGAIIGGVLGAVLGNSLSGNHRFDNRANYAETRSYPPAPAYYEQRTVYQQPRPSYSSTRRNDYTAPVAYAEPAPVDYQTYRERRTRAWRNEDRREHEHEHERGHGRSDGRR
ncbi:MAG: hypothetical protein ACI83P_002413 [Janthinobacterium sp.]|jgi:hypothetical protein